MKSTRRTFIKTAAIVTTGGVVLSSRAGQITNSLWGANEPLKPFELPKLGYHYNALEPFIDAETMMLHHSKHHQAYIDKLNEAMKKDTAMTAFKSLDDMLKNVSKLSPLSKQAAINHGGGHWNHSFFWPLLKHPKVGRDNIGLRSATEAPSHKLKDAIQNQFGSVENFRKEFEKVAAGVFGSGWAWLIVNNNKLEITSTMNQENPLMAHVSTQGKPVIGLDVWEHAYYLKYQNLRAEYIKAFWSVLNWEQAEKNFVQ